MTSTATSQVIAEWIKVFPRQATETYTGSVTFMKQLTVVAVSSITYFRKIFSNENYTCENFGGVKLRILKKKCPDELAQFVSTALTQAFEAFDKKYLHQLALCFYDGHSAADNLLEYHMFEFEYKGEAGGVAMRSGSRAGRHAAKYTFNNVREHTVSFIQRLMEVIAQMHQRLPDFCDVSLRLYYNDAAPESYQAPGFQASSEEHLTSTLNEGIKLGHVETPFHRVLGITYFKDHIGSSNEPNPTQNPPELTLSDDEDFQSILNGPRLRCDCNRYIDHEDLQLLTCEQCKSEQHAVCYGVRSTKHVPRHVCTPCADGDPSLSPTDTMLCELSVDKRECLCMFRRVLWHCSRHETVSAQQLAELLQIPLSSVAKMMTLLDNYHILVHRHSHSDPNTQREVNTKQVKNTMKKFFQSEETNIVDRLLAETLSQSSQPDPVGDVLSPMEKIKLQNETSIVKVTENNPAENTTEDSTLKEYREALLSSSQQMDEDLPPSVDRNPVKGIEKKEKKIFKRKLEKTQNIQEFKKSKTGVKTKTANAT